MINSSIRFKILSELMKFFINNVFLLFDVIFFDVFFFFQREGNIHKLINIIFINGFCLKKFNSGDPLMSLIFCCTSKFHGSCMIVHYSFLHITCNGNVKIISRRLHHSFRNFIDIFNFDNS